MSKTTYYKQCRYERETTQGKLIDVAWIPEKLAVVGKVIYLDKFPEALWTVTAVGSKRMPYSDLKAKEKVNRKYGQSAGLNCD